MNIFYLDNDPKLCAEWAVDKHVVKMILEAAQLLSTAHRVLDGHQTVGVSRTGRKKTTWELDNVADNKFIYSATHVNHPCAVWCRQTSENYLWLWQYCFQHCIEYNNRYGKLHKIVETGLLYRLMTPPRNIKFARFTPPPSCMDAKYLISENVIENYRNYYKVGKAHLHSWKLREAPPWIN